MERPVRSPRIVGGSRRSAVTATAGSALAALLLAGCVANPPSAVENPAEETPAAAVRTDNTVTVAIDGIGRGFNPHLLADQSPTTAAVAGLVLPSAFRYQPGPANPAAAELTMDTSVLVSAEVVSEAPFAVEYQLQNAAQWSDGAPIAVEDFRYLWQRMISEPGVVDPAGYRLITDVAASGEGGKTVKVTFAAPYPAWQSLFDNLVPAHLVKDSLGGFTTLFKDAIPVSGGQFKAVVVDRGRNEIVLDRNDRFWGEVAAPDRIVFRRGFGPGSVTNSMRAADAQLTTMRGGAALMAQLSTIPGVQVSREPQPSVLSLTLNARSPQLANNTVREGLLGLLDPELLAIIGGQSESAVTPVRSQLLAPSESGYADTAPAPIGAAAALGLLVDAGYRVGSATTGRSLALTVVAPSLDEISTSVANAAADAWRDAGIEVTVSTEPNPDQLYGEDLLDGSTSVLVGWRRVGGDLATEIASRFGCVGQQGTDAAAADESENPPQTADVGPGGTVRRPPSNLGGLCVEPAQAQIAAALSGERPALKLAQELDPLLWRLNTTVPILQDSTVVAIGDTLVGAMVRRPIAAGLFVDVGNWARVSE